MKSYFSLQIIIVMLTQLYFLCTLQLVLCYTIEIKLKLTLDEFFNYTTYPLLNFSPTGQW